MLHRLIAGLRFALDSLVIALVLFGLLNVCVGWFGGPDRNDVWVKGTGTAWLTSILISLLAAGLLPRSWRGGHTRRRIGQAAALLLGTFCLLDTLGFFAVLRGGGLDRAGLVPLSLLLACVLLGWSLWPDTPVRPTSHPLLRGTLRAAGVLVAGGALVALHLLTFGATDYRRPADAAIVFGAAVRADGAPSGALADRTATACRLYHAGLVSHLVLSGGRDPAAPVSEPACMATFALAEGVPAHALVLDETGRTTDFSLEALDRIGRKRGWTRFLGVSHDVHLARVRLLAERRGLTLFTVPAEETVPWPTKPLFVLREVLAWSWHFSRSVLAVRPMATR